MRTVRRLKKLGKKNIEEAIKSELIQLAAFIDTDGSINALERYPHISFVGRSKLPFFIWNKWGGCLNKYYDKGWEYMWTINARKEVKAFLLALEPYLLIKQEQARVALKMVELLEKKPTGYKQKLWQLKDELSRLNHTPAPDNLI
jgi:hypothetical protein